MGGDRNELCARRGGIAGTKHATAHTWTFVLRTRCASPEYVRRNIPRNCSVVRSPMSRTSSSGGWHATRGSDKQGLYDAGTDGRTDLCAHLQLYDLDLICDDWWFGALVEGGVEHFDSVCMELVREAGPLKRKGHSCGEERRLCCSHRKRGRSVV